MGGMRGVDVTAGDTISVTYQPTKVEGMADKPNVGHEIAGGEFSAVVQAGSIQSVSFVGLLSPTHLIKPRQLPLGVRGFTGRFESLAALDALLVGATESSTGAVVISAVNGAAGVGKTALALHWAHRVQHHFPDGTLFANLQGYGPGEPASAC